MINQERILRPADCGLQLLVSTTAPCFMMILSSSYPDRIPMRWDYWEKQTQERK